MKLKIRRLIDQQLLRRSLLLSTRFLDHDSPSLLIVSNAASAF
jgi:hypothetical protein